MTAFLGISASTIDRSRGCPSWTAFPQVRRTTVHAERGTDIHAYLRAILSGTPQVVALAAVDDEHRETCRLVDWQKLCGDLENIETEVAYAINVRTRTARRLGTNIDRDYEGAAARAGQPLTEDDVTGSLDITGTRKSDGLRVVVDVKSGHQDVTATEENGQGLFFAAVYQLLEGASEVQVRMAKLKPTGAVWNDPATFGAWQVDDFLDELEAAMGSATRSRRVYLAGGTPDVSVGSWCQYCPAKTSSCPAFTSLARAMLPELTDIADRMAEFTPEQRGMAWRKAKQIETILESVLDSLKGFAKTEPFPTDADHEVGASSYEQSRFSQPDALALLRGLGASEPQIAGLFKSATVTKIQERKIAGAARKRRSAA